MVKDTLNVSEKSPEHIPTLEEVSSILKKLAEKKYTEDRKLADEKGLYLLDVTVPGKLEGETIEYSYRRGQCHADKHLVSAIQRTDYEGGRPISGTTVAQMTNGKWEIVKIYDKADPKVRASVEQVLGIARHVGIKLNEPTNALDKKVELYLKLRIDGSAKYTRMSDQHVFAEVLRLQEDAASLEKLIKAYPNISFG